MQLSRRSLPQTARRPMVTLTVMGAVAAGWIVQAAVRRVDGGGADPLLNAGALTTAGLHAGQWWQAGTHFFVTAGPVWLAVTGLVVLALAGRGLERTVGGRHVGVVFVLAGVLGGLGQVGFDALLGESVRVTGVSSSAMGVLLALACVAPRTPLLPWGRAAGWAPWQRVKAVHGTLGALAAAVAAGTTPPAAGALVGGLTGCLYVHALGFCGRRADDGDEQAERAQVVSAASSASWPPGTDGSAATPKMQTATTTGDAPAVLTAPATAARRAVVVARFTERERRMSAREFIAEKVDPVLEKISREGLGSLTAEERQLLEKAREKMGAG